MLISYLFLYYRCMININNIIGLLMKRKVKERERFYPVINLCLIFEAPPIFPIPLSFYLWLPFLTYISLVMHSNYRIHLPFLSRISYFTSYGYNIFLLDYLLIIIKSRVKGEDLIVKMKFLNISVEELHFSLKWTTPKVKAEIEKLNWR